MTITSIGYAGTVDYDDWSILVARAGSEYGILGAQSFEATAGSGDRAVAISAGEAIGHGIRDLSDDTVTVTGTPVSSGSRWDLIALRRDWEAGESTIVIIPGSASRAIPGAPGRKTDPAVTQDDQPLWLVRFAAGQTAVQEFVDLRLWVGAGGLVARHVMVRDYLNRVGTMVMIQGAAWVLDFNSSGLPAWNASSIAPSGSLVPFAGTAAPPGWLLCEGQAVSRTTYASLFAVLGTRYGAGDGSTTFNLPNMKGRVPVGRDGAQSEFDTLGETGGAKTHTLTVAQMPSHTHTQNPHSHTSGGNGFFVNTDSGANLQSGSSTNRVVRGSTAAATATNQNTGGGQPHNNLQPYIALNYLIKT